MQNRNQLGQDRGEEARPSVTLSDVLEIHFDFIYFELYWLKFKAKANIPHFLWSEVKCENSVLNSWLDAQPRVWSMTAWRFWVTGNFSILLAQPSKKMRATENTELSSSETAEERQAGSPSALWLALDSQSLPGWPPGNSGNVAYGTDSL